MNSKTRVTDPIDRPVNIPPAPSPRHEEALIDQSVAETFPASDPIAPAVPERTEPADTLRNARSERSRRSRNTAAWVGFGTAALALLTMRAIRGRRERPDID